MGATHAIPYAQSGLLLPTLLFQIYWSHPPLALGKSPWHT